MSDPTNIEAVLEAGNTPTSPASWESVEEVAENFVAEQEPSEEEDSEEPAEELEEETEEEADDDIDSEESEDDSDGDAESDEEEPEEEEREVPAVAKTYKAKGEDGKEVELPDNLLFKKKIDGRYRQVSLKEVVDAYSGEVAYDRKFEALAEREKNIEAAADAVAADKQLADSYASDVIESLDKGDFPGAILALADLSNKDTGTTVKSIIEGFTGYFNQLAQMPPEEQRAALIQLQNDSNERKFKRQKDIETSQARAKQVSNELAKLSKDWGISDVEKEETYEEIKSLVEEGKALDGKMSNLTPELLVATILDNRILNNIKEAATELEVELNPDTRRFIFQQVQNLGYTKTEEFELEDYKDFVRELASTSNIVSGKAADNLSRKVSSTKKATPKKVKRKTKPKKVNKDLHDVWDSI